MVKKAAISVGFIVFCSGILLCNTFAADPIKVGVLLPLSGRNAAIGQIQKNAVLMAVAEINARGRIKDRKMDLVLADTKGTPDGGRAAIQMLIQTGNVRVIGVDGRVGPLVEAAMDERQILVFMGQFSLVPALTVTSFLLGGLAGALIFAVLADYGLRRFAETALGR